jgi:hypothetical protein
VGRDASTCQSVVGRRHLCASRSVGGLGRVGLLLEEDCINTPLRAVPHDRSVVLPERQSNAVNSAGSLRLIRPEICSEKSLPNCRGVIDPAAFFETESLS